MESFPTAACLTMLFSVLVSGLGLLPWGEVLQPEDSHPLSAFSLRPEAVREWQGEQQGGLRQSSTPRTLQPRREATRMVLIGGGGSKWSFRVGVQSTLDSAGAPLPALLRQSNRAVVFNFLCHD